MTLSHIGLENLKKNIDWLSSSSFFPPLNIYLVKHINFARDGDALVVRAGRELDNHLGARPLLCVVQGPEPDGRRVSSRVPWDFLKRCQYLQITLMESSSSPFTAACSTSPIFASGPLLKLQVFTFNSGLTMKSFVSFITVLEF